MKRFTIPCLFDDESHPCDLYIGEPCAWRHPLAYQSEWLRMARGGVVPDDVMQSFRTLLRIAKEHDVNYAELCADSLDEAIDEVSPANSQVIDFARYKRTRGNYGPLLSSAMSIHDTYFFGALPIKGAQLVSFCRHLAEEISIAMNHRHDEVEFIAEFLGLLFFLLGATQTSMDASEWKSRIASYLSKDEDAPGEYQLAIALDTLGYLIPMRWIMAGDFYIFSMLEVQSRMREMAIDCMRAWSALPISEAELKFLRDMNIAQEAYQLLKKYLKTPFHTL